ncbi:hypothetical protein EJB05_40136, partial [Eragrostis curvula]
MLIILISQQHWLMSIPVNGVLLILLPRDDDISELSHRSSACSPSSEEQDVTPMDKLGPNPVNSCPLTPLGFLERAATVFADSPSIIYHDTVFTWSQTLRRCFRLASALVSLGISRCIQWPRPFRSKLQREIQT